MPRPVQRRSTFRPPRAAVRPRFVVGAGRSAVANGTVPTRDRPQLVVIWESLTKRRLDDAKLRLMISRPAFGELNRYLDARGARWLRARAAECLSRSRSGYVLRLDDWLREC